MSRHSFDEVFAFLRLRPEQNQFFLKEAVHADWEPQSKTGIQCRKSGLTLKEKIWLLVLSYSKSYLIFFFIVRLQRYSADLSIPDKYTNKTLSSVLYFHYYLLN